MLDGNTYICKLIVVTNYYFELAMYHWLLVEGIYLYIMVGLVFNSDRIKMWMYKVIGWGLPLIHSLIFCLMMRSYNDTTCWFVGDSSINWTRRGPILFILAFNLLILLHIIRILMTQMQTGQLNHDSNQVKKAIKATLVLSPLLGITYIVLLVSPGKTQSTVLELEINTYNIQHHKTTNHHIRFSHLYLSIFCSKGSKVQLSPYSTALPIKRFNAY